MIPEILNSYALTLDHVRRLVADVRDADMTAQPRGAPNHPAWTLGHMALSAQLIGGELGLEPWLPPEWVARFGPGSAPDENRAGYPAKAALLAMLEKGRNRISDGLSALGERGMSQQLPDERFRKRYPTLGHAVLDILAGHSALHVGQLVVWRRAMGLPPVVVD